MTAWADYSFFAEQYLIGRASALTEADFPSYAVSATAYVKLLVGDNVDDGAVPDEVKYAVCAIAEAMADCDAAESHGGIASEITGDLHVTYESAASRDAALDEEIRRIARSWLTPWMYLGVRSC